MKTNYSLSQLTTWRSLRIPGIVLKYPIFKRIAEVVEVVVVLVTVTV
jgi:hypothetical protein